MEDKRITKTKQNLKQTMIRLLAQSPFEKITVSALCRESMTSRITFYTHYDDKYALAEDMFVDYVNEAIQDYHRLQKENNPARSALYGYYNMLDCILNLYYNNLSFFECTAPERNPYLYSAFYRHIFENVEYYIERHSSQVAAKYPARQTAALLCNGLWGVINECYAEQLSRASIRNTLRSMLHALLTSSLFSAGAPFAEQ